MDSKGGLARVGFKKRADARKNGFRLGGGGRKVTGLEKEFSLKSSGV